MWFRLSRIAGWTGAIAIVIAGLALTACSSASTTATPNPAATATTEPAAAVAQEPEPPPTELPKPTATPAPTATPQPTPTPQPAERFRSAIEPFASTDSLLVTVARREPTDTDVVDTVAIDAFSVVGDAVELQVSGATQRVIAGTLFESESWDYNDDGVDESAWRYRPLDEVAQDELPRTRVELLETTSEFLAALADSAEVTNTTQAATGREFVATIPTEALAGTLIGQQLGIQEAGQTFSLEVLSNPNLQITIVDPDPAQQNRVVWVHVPDLAEAAIEVPARRLPASSTFETTCLEEEQPNSFVDTSCANFHSLRIYASHRMPASMSTLDFDEAERRCLQILLLRNDDAGLSAPADNVSMGLPSDAQWDVGARQVECFVNFLEPVTGPLNDLTTESGN